MVEVIIPGIRISSSLLAKVTKPIKQPQLSKRHKTKRLEWARRYMKTDFQNSNVLFTDECRATLMDQMAGRLVCYFMVVNLKLGLDVSKVEEGDVLGKNQRRFHHWTFQSRARGQNRFRITL